jgi:ElaB/YqjD/DUF883 family membrane-anchored ribosome-binding protein
MERYKTFQVVAEGIVNDLQDQIDNLERNLVSYRTSSKHKLQTMRSRMLGLLRGDLTRWLETAQDAATVDPPRIRVITERIDQALRKIEQEAQWLDRIET